MKSRRRAVAHYAYFYSKIMRVRNDDAVSRSLLSLPDMAGSGGVMMARIQSSVISRHQFSQPVQQQVIIGKFHVGRGQMGIVWDVREYGSSACVVDHLNLQKPASKLQRDNFFQNESPQEILSLKFKI